MQSGSGGGPPPGGPAPGQQQPAQPLAGMSEAGKQAVLLRMLIALKAVSEAAAHAKAPAAAPVQPSLQLPQRPPALQGTQTQQGGGQTMPWSSPQPAGGAAAGSQAMGALDNSPPAAPALQQQQQATLQSPQPQLQLPASLVQQLLRSPVTPLTQAPPPLPFNLGSPGATPTGAAPAAAAAAAPAALDGSGGAVAGFGSMPAGLGGAAGGMAGMDGVSGPSLSLGLDLGLDLGSAEPGGPSFQVPLWSPADVLPATLGTGGGEGLEGLLPLPPLPPGMELPPLPGMPGGAPLMPDGLPPMYRTRAPRSEWGGGQGGTWGRVAWMFGGVLRGCLQELTAPGLYIWWGVAGPASKNDCPTLPLTESTLIPPLVSLPPGKRARIMREGQLTMIVYGANEASREAGAAPVASAPVYGRALQPCLLDVPRVHKGL